MSLDNLVGRALERVEPDRTGIARMLAAAERNVVDAGLAALSPTFRGAADILCLTDGN